MKKVDVVGAVIYDKNQNKYLATMRNKEKNQGGLWEFPGGKIEEGENPETALIREIKEELNCIIEVKELLVDHTHQYRELTVRLITYLCTINSGIPRLNEHEAMTWVCKEELPSLTWAEADIPTVQHIIKQYN